MDIVSPDTLWGPSADHRRDRMVVAFLTSLVALATDIPAQDIAARRRSTLAATRARQITIYLAHVGLAWPLWRVAAAFNRDRTTAGHAIRIVEELRDDPSFDGQMTGLEACLREAPAR